MQPLIGATETAGPVRLRQSRFNRFVQLIVFPGTLVKVPGCEMLFRRAVLERWAAGLAAL